MDGFSCLLGVIGLRRTVQEMTPWTWLTLSSLGENSCIWEIWILGTHDTCCQPGFNQIHVWKRGFPSVSCFQLCEERILVYSSSIEEGILSPICVLRRSKKLSCLSDLMEMKEGQKKVCGSLSPKSWEKSGSQYGQVGLLISSFIHWDSQTDRMRPQGAYKPPR